MAVAGGQFEQVLAWHHPVESVAARVQRAVQE